MEPEVLESNQGKFGISVNRSSGGAIFIDRARYIQAGMENENIVRLPGNAYHLPHQRGINSLNTPVNHG